MVYRCGAIATLLIGNGIDYTGPFRALAAAIAVLPASTLLLDGEVTAFDEHLLSRRAVLHPDPHALVTPPIYIAFDCVHARGRDLREHPLGARRDVLERLIDDQHLLFPARRLPAHGLAAWAEVQRRGSDRGILLQGVIGARVIENLVECYGIGVSVYNSTGGGNKESLI